MFWGWERGNKNEQEEQMVQEAKLKKTEILKMFLVAVVYG